MDATPLSHHAILELAAPFSRAGLALDLPASDRAARRLRFKTRTLPAGPDGGSVTETLSLEDTGGGRWRLLRTLQPADPTVPPGRVSAEGIDPALLLARVMALPPERPFWRGAHGEHAALTLHAGAGEHWVLREAEGRAAGLRLQLSVSGVAGYAAELQLLRDEADSRRLPDDLLEVLGQGYTRLVPIGRRWDSSVRLRGAEPRRSAEAEARLHQALSHLAQTLSEPPLRFHQRHRAARWRLGLLRGVPLLLGVGLVALAFALRDSGSESDARLAALANLAPPLLMALFFMRREMPRIELPRLPRAPAAGSWKPGTGAPPEP